MCITFIHIARMAERLRRATQVRMEQSSWVRFPLLAFCELFVSQKASLRLLQVRPLQFRVSAYQKTKTKTKIQNRVSSVGRASAFYERMGAECRGFEPRTRYFFSILHQA
jgi:hypothetical protein